jgi:hypothetical protein
MRAIETFASQHETRTVRRDRTRSRAGAHALAFIAPDAVYAPTLKAW